MILLPTVCRSVDALVEVPELGLQRDMGGLQNADLLQHAIDDLVDAADGQIFPDPPLAVIYVCCSDSAGHVGFWGGGGNLFLDPPRLSEISPVSALRWASAMPCSRLPGWSRPG